MPIFEYACDECSIVMEELVLHRDADVPPACLRCKRPTHKIISTFTTPEWGGPKFDHAAQQQFASRSEQQAHWKSLGMMPAGDKVGGARNEDHLRLGKTIYGTGSKSRRTSKFAF